MPEHESKYFGVIKYSPEAVIEFSQGLPGFEDEHRFLLIEQEINRPLVFLQSLARPDLCFITIPVADIVPDYKPCLSEEDQCVAGNDALCLGIVALSEDGPPTVNLLSPIVVNWQTRRAVQAVQADSEYSHRHPLGAPCS